MPQMPHLPPLDFASISAKTKTNTKGLRRMVDASPDKPTVNANTLRIDGDSSSRDEPSEEAVSTRPQPSSTALTVVDPSRMAAFSIAPVGSSQDVSQTARPLQITAPVPAPPTSLTTRGDLPTNGAARMARIEATLSGQHKFNGGALNGIASWPLRSGVSTSPRAPEGGSSRMAPLALEVEAFIRKETKQLMRDEQHPSNLQLLSVHREAFRVLLSRFPEYSGVLSTIQRQYDATVDELSASHGTLVRLEVEHKAVHESYRLEREHATAKHSDRIKDLQGQIASLSKQLAASEVSRGVAEHAQMRVNDIVHEKDNDIDELMERVRTLSSTLREQASKAGKYVMQLGKARTDNVRLLDLCTSLQRGFVGEYGRANAAEEALLEFQQSGVAPAKPPAPGQVRRPRAQSNARKKVVLVAGEEVDITNIKKEVDSIREQAMVGVDRDELVRRMSMSGAATGAEAVAKRRSTVGSVVPGDDPTANLRMYDYANLGEEDDLREKVLSIEAELKKTQKRLVASQGEVKSLLARLDDVQKAQQDDTMTPRPQWVRLQDDLPEFQLNFLSSTADIVDDLVGFMKDKVRTDLLDNERKAYGNTIVQWLGEENMCESDLVHIGKFFVGRGTGPHVPIYLRAHGKIRDLRLTKGHVENLLKKFWSARKARIKHSQIGGMKVTEFDVFFLEWLTEETGTVGKAIDLAYNVLAVCSRYQRDPDCGIFTRVLNGEVCELAVFDQEETVGRLFEAIQKLDTRNQGLVTRISIHRVLSKLFPAKGRHDMHRLRFALITFAMGADVVDYGALFKEDGDGNQSKFIELLRSQHLHEITSHVVDVEEALREVVVDPEDRRTPTRSMHSVEDIDEEATPIRRAIELAKAREVLRDLDHQLPASQLEEIIAYGCGLTTADLASAALFSTPAEPFFRRIRTGALLKRYSPKMKERKGSQCGELTEDDEESDMGPDLSSDPDGQQRGVRRLVKRGSIYEQNIASALQRMNSNLRSSGNSPTGGNSRNSARSASVKIATPMSRSSRTTSRHASPPSSAPHPPGESDSPARSGRMRRRKGNGK